MNAHKSPSELERVSQYLSGIREGVNVKDFLGEGTDGAVWSTSRNSAAKGPEYERGYFNDAIRIFG